jgi:hypothetical protein
LVERGGDVAVGVGVDAEGDEHLRVWQGGQGHRLLLAGGCSVARTSRTADSTAMGPVGQALIRSLRQTGGAEDARPDRPTDPIPGSKASGFQGSDRQGGRLDHHPRSGFRLSYDAGRRNLYLTPEGALRLAFLLAAAVERAIDIR